MKILICDDAGFVREILGQALRELGHEVVGEARDGTEAIEQARRLRPDVVFLDLVLPLKNGTEAGREMREHNPVLKIVYCSTVEEAFLARKASEAGGDAWIAKPFTKSELKATLDGLKVGKAKQEVKHG